MKDKLKKPRWFHLEKFYRGGSTISYIESTDEVINDAAEDWGENSDGGSNYGYTVRWKKVRKPPKKWIVDKIKNLEADNAYSEKRIRERKENIEYFRRNL